METGADSGHSRELIIVGTERRLVVHQREMVAVYDTTLRDGAQGSGVSFSLEDKLQVTRRLAQLGVAYVEGGWPSSNPKDAEYFRLCRRMDLGETRLAAFGSTRRAGKKASEDGSLRGILAAETGVGTIVGKSSAFQVREVLGVSLEENLRMIEESVEFLNREGLEVFFDAEHFFDGFREDPDYAILTLRAAEAGGASGLVLCDTRGGSLPWQVVKAIVRVRDICRVPLGIHAHNDGGLAVANTLVAVRKGVAQVQGTVNGYGERCGNANLCSVIPNLELKQGVRCLPEGRLAQLASLAHFVSEMANLPADESQPFVGANAFTHKAGLHVGAVLKTPTAYEHVDPATVGGRRRVPVSELSGKSNLLYKAREAGLELDKESPSTTRLLEKIKELEHQGYQFEGAEASFELLARKILGVHQTLFQAEEYRVLVERKGGIGVEATVKVRVGELVFHTAAEGNGPVNALDNALRKALLDSFPQLNKIRLADYKVRVLEGKDGTGARVRVLIESSDEHGHWNTVGVSTDILEASWLALVDSLEYGLGLR